MSGHIHRIALICVASLITGCVNLSRTYYAPTAVGGTFLPPIEPACFRPLDWVRLSDNGATLDLKVGRGDKELAVLLLVNSHKSDAPIVSVDLGKVSLQNPTESGSHFPFATYQVDVRKSPDTWSIEPLLVTKGGYYMFRYSDIEDIRTEAFVLKFPEVSVNGRITKLPIVTFQKTFGTACESGKK